MPLETPDPFAVMVIDRRSPWLAELAASFARRTDLRVYSGSPSALGRLSSRLRTISIAAPPLEVTDFPVQRGYFSFPLRHLLDEHRRMARWFLSGLRNPARVWLVCCYPQYAKTAALWPGPVAYYVTDLFSRYEGASFRGIAAMEKYLCRRAALVFPNSQRIADYLIRHCGCDPARTRIVPNAVRQSNLLLAPAIAPLELPADAASLPRPVAGVIGNMGGNIDWLLLEQVVAQSPWLSWLFVGPTSARIEDPVQARARASLMAAGGRVRFLGPKPYGELKAYARAVDVAALPYAMREPTYSGSSTRYYEHLAACRPMLATDGFEELLHRGPFVRVLKSAGEWATALEQLRCQGFRDGLEESRWRQSQGDTWDDRARALHDAMAEAAREASRPALV
jgi:glycosyltransferase involved in cell wall biosynthesis